MRISRCSRPAQVLTAVVYCLAVETSAAACDFEKAVGQCTATIRILEAGGEKPKFTAKVDVTSSAQACSKVSVVFANTPWTFFIRSGGRQTGTIQTPNAVRDDTTKIVECATYAGDVKANASTTAASMPSDPFNVTGLWRESDEMMFELFEKDGKIAGMEMLNFQGDTPGYYRIAGTRQGKKLTLTAYISDEPSTFGFVLKDANTMERVKKPGASGHVVYARNPSVKLANRPEPVNGLWDTLDRKLRFNLTERDGKITGFGSSTGVWPELMEGHRAMSDFDLRVEGTRDNDKVTLNVTDRTGAPTSTEYEMRDGHSLWAEDFPQLVRFRD
ncbi:hypothetical protein K9B32_16390 [Rhizobium sp. 3T7]|uniref:hypothetical protein n=1 Tax=Rhizobium sp. 3T7 TaxID=2874922 RepID=UPI001CCAA59A|nr:hypothetical protein [Rhizobium sp. 3T7]MBZ9791685.1 hypothetical protein [Rhizobium sp. 3T7]